MIGRPPNQLFRVDCLFGILYFALICSTSYFTFR
jgi:hypothetical protein